MLNLLSTTGVDFSRTVSALGYCLLPMVILAMIGVVLPLRGAVGYLLSALAVAWCSNSASVMFVTALQMRDQRLLVAYPLALVYTIFAILTMF